MVRLATGIQGFDAMVQGGLPVGSSVVLQGPPGQEKLRFALTFLAEGLKAGASGLVVVSSQSSDAVLATLRNLGVDLDAVTNENRLRIVDWYSWSEETVQDIEDHGLVLRSSIDLTNLGVALSRAIAGLAGDQSRRAVIELLSPAMNVYELTQVYAFAQSAKKKFDRHRFTSLVLLEKDMHSGPEITTLHQPFDGVIEIERTRSGDRIVRKVGVLHLKDTTPDPTFRTLEMTREGMRVVVESRKPAAHVSPVSTGPGTVLESQEERAHRLTLIMEIASERLKLDPRDADALFALAAAQATLDDSRGGLQTLERLADLDPNYPGLWVLKTKLHAKLGETDRARQSRVRAQEPESGETTASGLTVPCPMCESPVSADATSCHHCGVKFAPTRSLEDELADLGHAAIQEMVEEERGATKPQPARPKPAAPKPPEPEPELAPAEKPAPAPKAPLKPVPRKGLTNGLVLARGAGRRAGMTNGLKGRTNGLRGRTNGLTNGLGRTNGLTNGVGRTNGLTNDLGRTNGLTNGLGRTNGLTNGLGRTNGITNGLGRTNGITNGLGRTNGLTNGLGGLRSTGFRSNGVRGMMRTAGWKLYMIPLVVFALLLMPLFMAPQYAGPNYPIRIDGQFADWSTVSTEAMVPGSVLNPNVDIVRFGVVDNLGPYAYFVQVAGSALIGGGAPPGTMDTVRIFIDIDALTSTGYRISGLGADRMVEVAGYGGMIRTSTLWEFDSNRDPRDWSGWIKGTSTAAAISDSRIEVEADWLFSTAPSVPAIAAVHTASWDGQADVGEFPVGPGVGSLSVTVDPLAPAVLSGTGVSLLRLTLTAHGQAATIDSLQVQVIGTAPPTAALSLRLMQGATQLAQATPISRDVTFTFPAVSIAVEATTVLGVVGDFTATGGDTLGVRLPADHPFGFAGAAVGLRTNPVGRSVGYLGVTPSTPRVDGAFDEWSAASFDPASDVAPRANADIDLTRYAAQFAGGSTFLYADVSGRIFWGTSVPEAPRTTPEQGPAPAPDTDRDTVPDSLDPMPYDFNNDGLPDAQTNGDYDGDLIPDYGLSGGTDYWLNTTLPMSFPAPYAGLPVQLYIGPTDRPPAVGEDALRMFLDLDNSTLTGYSIGGLGADRLVELRGKDGQVTQTAMLAFSGSFPGEWSWTAISPVTGALGYHAVELSIAAPVTDVYMEAGDFWGASDSTTSAPAYAPGFTSFKVSAANQLMSVPWIQVGPQPSGTLIDGGSGSTTTVYNHQRKLVRAGNTPGTACDATNSDGCWYAVIYDQLAEDQATTAASTETITDGTKVAGTFATDIQSENAVYIQYRETPPVTAKVGSFNIGTGAVSSTVAITGVGFQPKVVIFWWSGRTESADTVSSVDHKRGFGVAVGSTDRRSVFSQSDDAALVAAADAGHQADAAIGALTIAGAIDGLADLQTMDSDGFTLVIDDQFATNLRVHYLALGGADVTNAVTGMVTEPASVGTQDVTSVGFQPDAVILFSAMIGADPPGTAVDSTMMIGVASGATPADAVWAAASNDGSDPTVTKSYSRAGESIALFDSGITATDGRADVTAWLSNGFRLNWAEVAGSRRIHYLALKGGQYLVGDLLTRTDTTTPIAESGFGFTPSAVLITGSTQPQNAADTPSTWDEWSLGAFTSATARVAQGTEDKDALATADVGTQIEFDEVHVDQGDAPGTTEALMDVQSVDADGFTLIMDDADDAQGFVWYLAVGGGAALDIKYDWSTVPSASAYTLKIKGYRSDENFQVQVLTPPSTWNTRITVSATSNTLYTYTLTASEYNSGSPSVRFIDATQGEGSASDLWIDWAAITSTDHWDRILLMRSSDTSGSTWGSQIILASGRTGDGALVLARDSAEPSIAIDSSGYLHVVWVSASTSGNQATFNLVRYTKTTVSYPTQSQAASGANWQAVTSVDDASTGFMPTVSTDTNNDPHVAWSGSKTSGTVYYKNNAGGTWRSTVSWGTTYTGISVDVSPQNNYVSLARYYEAATNEIQYLACKNLSTSVCDASGEFTKWDGTAGVDTVATAVETASYPSLATTHDVNADLWVAYAKDVDGSTRAIYVRFLDYTSAGWAVAETVDSVSGSIFTKPSIGVDKDNTVHALYVRTSGPQVYYRNRVGGSWGSDTAPSTETITKGTKISGTFAGDLVFEDTALLQYREAAGSVSAKAGSFSITTNSPGATVPVTGVGFQPKVVLFWWSGRTEESDITDGKHIVRGFGVAASPTDRRAVYTQSPDGSSNAAADAGHHDAAAIGALSLTGSVVGLADLQSMDSDGFTMIIDDQFPDSLRISYLALGGTDLTNTATGMITEPSTTGEQQITSLSFQPNALVFFSAMIGADPPGTAVDSTMMIGVAAGATPSNAVWAGGSNDAAGTMQTISYNRAGESIALFDATITGTDARAGVTSWLSNGFTLNWAERAGSRRIHYLALKGAVYRIGDLLTQTDTSTQIVENGFGFSPKAGLLGSNALSQSSQDVPQDSDRWSLGAFTSTTARAAQGTQDLDGSSDSQTATSLEQDEVYVSINNLDQVEGLMDIQSVGSDGFTTIMDDADPSQRFVWYFAIGAPAFLEVRYDWTGVPSGSAYTLTVKGYRVDENIDVQVLTNPSTWNTRITIAATSNTLHLYTLTSAEYDSGTPSIRFVDADRSDGSLSDVFLDVALVASGNSRALVDTSSDNPTLVVRAPNDATYGTTVAGLYWKSSTSETYFHIPEFDAVVVPIALTLLVLWVRRRRAAIRRAPSAEGGSSVD